MEKERKQEEGIEKQDKEKPLTILAYKPFW